MNEIKNKRIFLVSIYFGKLPNYFCLWLASCARNKDFNWIFITDNDLSGYSIPENVIVNKMKLEEIGDLFSERLGFKVCLTSPYKLCDFRPIYWILLDKLRIKYDFWGHCDIDVIFGKLADFITPELLSKHDRIFGLGHLSVIRSSPISKLVFSLRSSAPNWRSIFVDSKNFGFDEHHGVNKIWKEYPLRYHENERIAADIDPQFKKFRLTQVPLNRNRQLFFYEDGRVFQGCLDETGQWKTREFAYIHFQKRKMDVQNGILDSQRILIGPAGFTAMPSIPTEKAEVDKLLGINDLTSDMPELGARFKTWLRFYRRKLIGGF